MRIILLLFAVMLVFPLVAHGQELQPLPTAELPGGEDAYYQAVVMSPEYGYGGGDMFGTSSGLLVDAEGVPIQAVNIPCTQYSGQQINASQIVPAGVADWSYNDYINACGNLGGPACAAAMGDKVYYAVSAYVGPGSLVSVPNAYFTGASSGNRLPPSEGRSASAVWGVTAYIDPYTIMDRDVPFPTPYVQTATVPFWERIGTVGLPLYHALFNDDFGNTFVQSISRGFIIGTGKIAKLIVQFTVPKLLLSTLRPVLKVCDRIETQIDLGNATAIARATATARARATVYVPPVRPSITPAGYTDPRSFYTPPSALINGMYTGQYSGVEIQCDANNSWWCEVRLDARGDPNFKPVNAGDSHCLIVESSTRVLQYLCIGAGVLLDAYNFSARNMSPGERVRVRCIQSTVGWPCPARSLRFTAQMSIKTYLGGDGLNLAATQTRKAVAATSTRAIATPTVTAGLVPTIPAYATNTATPAGATTATRTAIARTATAQSTNRTATAAYILAQRQTATAYAAVATNQALARGSATAQVAQTATAQLYVQQTAYARATQEAYATATRGTAIDNNRSLAGRDPAVQDAAINDLTGRTSVNGLLAGVSSLFTTFGQSLAGSPCLAPVGMSVMGLPIDASGQMFQSDQLFSALCTIRTWLESDTRVIPVMRGIISAVMLLGFGLLIMRYFTNRS